MSKWEMVKLGEIARVSAGQSAPKENRFSKVGIPFVRAGSLVKLLDGLDETNLELIENDTAIKLKLKKQNKGTILFAKSGMSCMKGHVYVLKNNAYAVSHLACVYPTKCDSSFLSYYFKYNQPNRLIKDESYPSISLKDIENIEIPLPPLDEQKRIAEELDKISGLIAKCKSQLEKMDLLVKSKFVEMFGDPVTNQMGWGRSTLKQLSIRLSDGPFGSNLKSEHYSSEGVRVIRLQNIGVGKFINKDKAYVSQTHYDTIKKYTCRAGDLVIATLGEPNLRACIIPKEIPFAINKADCVHYIPNPSVLNSLFTCQYLNSPAILNFASDKMHGQTRTRISSGQVAQLPIYVPPINLQNQFADYVTKVEQTKTKLHQGLEQLETLYKARMQEYFG